MLKQCLAMVSLIFLSWAEVHAGPCEAGLGDEQVMPRVFMEAVFENPQRFVASDGAPYYLSDLKVIGDDSPEVKKFTANNFVSVKPLADEMDRWGRRPAILLDQNRRDLSSELVESGMAMVRPQFRAFNCLKFLINLERTARREKAGIWAVKNVINDYLSIGYERFGLYEILEVRLISVGQTRSKTYLNFGERWTEDLTGIIQRGMLEEFLEFGHDLSAMSGKRVRLRGVLQMDQGPMIELRHPAQLELLD
ncbi:hypothetical protein PsAD2_01164 [Pseudovibrio axinellae]|uniref:TNase-like domain-containing protein n=1 Tax=Pseudovibrio axinellae TaxID=989403 RepID=A0A166A6M5_9HYPH|nr:thermonuclease family protein [Pseudovibrio axinellae]KZL20676.1 hypothetical protein PsAD2_01164 [Pseudovibrio axinellae]SER26014.1 nuclease homologue [Pseudovibrio axinellae]